MIIENSNPIGYKFNSLVPGKLYLFNCHSAFWKVYDYLQILHSGNYLNESKRRIKPNDPFIFIKEFIQPINKMKMLIWKVIFQDKIGYIGIFARSSEQFDLEYQNQMNPPKPKATIK